MSRFLNILKVAPYGDGVNFCVLEDFKFEYGAEDSGAIITVPAGFITDFTSVPRVFWDILPPWGKYGFAAVIHDWLYYDQSLTRDQADDILLDAMSAMGVSEVDRITIYAAVHKAGQHAWDQNAKKKETGFIRVAQDLPRSVTDRPFYWEGN